MGMFYTHVNNMKVNKCTTQRYKIPYSIHGIDPAAVAFLHEFGRLEVQINPDSVSSSKLILTPLIPLPTATSCREGGTVVTVVSI